MKLLALAFVMLLSLSIPSSAQDSSAGELKKVSLSTLDWPPYIAPSGLSGRGYIYEIVHSVFEAQGYEVDIRFYPWARALALAQSGETDGYFPEYFNEDLKKDFVYSKPMPGGPVGFMKRKGQEFPFKIEPDMKDFTPLMGYKIGVVRGYTNTAAFDKFKGLSKDESNDDLTNINKLLKGRLDLVFIDPNVAIYLAYTTLNQKHNQIEFIQPALEMKDLYVCFSKKSLKNKTLLNDFNEGYKKLQESGQIAKILIKHEFENGLWKKYAINQSP